MESKPIPDPQMRFEEKGESVKAGDVLRYVAEDGGYFLNQVGFRIHTLPIGTRIKIKGFAIALGVYMPECEGTIAYRDGKIIFNFESKGPVPYVQESNFWNGDVFEII